MAIKKKSKGKKKATKKAVKKSPAKKKAAPKKQAKEKSQKKKIPKKASTKKTKTTQKQTKVKLAPSVKPTTKEKKKASSSKDQPKLSKAQLRAATAHEKQWMGYYNKNRNAETSPYKMSGVYEAKSVIEHKTFGWGYVLSSKNDRLEVIFQDATRFLVSNNLGIEK